MELLLDEDDVGRLNHAARVLLSPADHSGLRSWVEASLRTTMRFLKAATAIMILPAADSTVLLSRNIPEPSIASVREALTRTDPASPPAIEKGQAGAVAFTRRVPLDHDVEPYVGLRTRTPAGPATLGFGYAGQDPFAPADRLAAARLLLPAFRTGVRSALDLDDARRAASDASQQLPGVRQIMAVHDLTRREAEVALLLARGASNRVAAEALSVSPHTVRKHAEHIFAKLGIHSRTVLALLLALGAGAG